MSLVSVDWLRAHRSDEDVLVCDVRWYLPTTGRSGADEYAAGHVTGAMFIDLDRDLAAPDDGRAGRHPLPAATDFEAAMRRVGVGPQTHVVAYDDAGGAYAARLWWLLRAHGHDRVSLVDGGWQAWTAAGGEIEQQASVRAPGAFVARPVAGAAIDLEGVRRHLHAGGLLLDARAAPRYRGETEPVDARPGHVPGAVNLPFTDLLQDGRFLAREPLRARLAAAGVGAGAVAAGCGSGVTACHLLFALDLTGLRTFPRATLYAGSYSEWARRRELPVALGAEPGTPA